jgi:hypothetical protein
MRKETRETLGLSQDYNLTNEIRNSPAYEERLVLTTGVSRFLRKLLHIQEVEIRTLRHREDHAQDNADLRLKYLLNEMSEQDFRVHLQRREKKRQKDMAVRDIYQMVCDTGRDVFWDYMDGGKDLLQTSGELNSLRTYANTHLTAIGVQYKMNVDLV